MFNVKQFQHKPLKVLDSWNFTSLQAKKTSTCFWEICLPSKFLLGSMQFCLFLYMDTIREWLRCCKIGVGWGGGGVCVVKKVLKIDG